MKKETGLLMIIFLASTLDILSTFFALEFFGLVELNGLVNLLYNINPISIFLYPCIVTFGYSLFVISMIYVNMKIEARVFLMLNIIFIFLAFFSNISWILFKII